MATQRKKTAEKVEADNTGISLEKNLVNHCQKM